MTAEAEATVVSHVVVERPGRRPEAIPVRHGLGPAGYARVEAELAAAERAAAAEGGRAGLAPGWLPPGGGPATRPG